MKKHNYVFVAPGLDDDGTVITSVTSVHRRSDDGVYNKQIGSVTRVVREGTVSFIAKRDYGSHLSKTFTASLKKFFINEGEVWSKAVYWIANTSSAHTSIRPK